MIRTRDFLLYILVLVFLLIAVTATWVRGSHSTESVAVAPVFSEVITNPEATTETTHIDQAARLAELRNKLAAGEGQILSAPPVFTSVDTVVVDDAMATDSAPMVGDRAVQYCGAPVPHPASFVWPANAQLAVLGDTAQVTALAQTVVTVGTSTKTVTEETVLASIPLRTVRSTFDTCLPDTTIGITPNGAYISNTDAVRYQTVSPATLVGYSRDGFGIYGPVVDESELDACGGRYHNFVYQYHVRPQENFMLGCYAGIPAPLNL